MKNLKLSKFDLGIIIAAVVIGLIGVGVWWYFSGQLATVVQDVQAANSDFNRYSTVKRPGNADVIVTPANQKILLANIEALKSKLIPLIDTKLDPKENKLAAVEKEDPVAWKAKLDDHVAKMAAAAKIHGVALAPKFYFGFSRYVGANPGDDQTEILSKQLLGVEDMVAILVAAPVNGIQAIRRVWEEDPRSTGNSTNFSSAGGGAADQLQMNFSQPAGGAYTAHPFEIEFDATPENLRKVVNALTQSPDIFVIRTLVVQNPKPASPLLNDLDKMAGTPTPSMIGSAPGAVAQANSDKAPVYLFGNVILHVNARIDLIEWTEKVTDIIPPVPGTSPNANPSTSGNP